MEAVDRDLKTLAASKAAWAQTSLARKIALLEAVKRRVHALAPAWVAAAANAKGLLEISPLAGEEWISGPWALLYALNRYLRTLRALDERGSSPVPGISLRANGQALVQAFPYDAYDRLLLGGISAQVWMQPGITPEQTRSGAASFYRQAQPPGRVALVLGAGNIASIAPLDVLYKMLAEGAVCMLKLNPVNEYLGPIFEHVLQPFTEEGFVRFAYGGAQTGAYLCAHRAVEDIHITGSARTCEIIARDCGTGKRITSELGNVTPTIVVPGPWSFADLRFQAENIATQKAHNAGFNCIAAQVLVLPAQWPHAQSLRERIAEVFARMEQLPEYYPGAEQRRTALAGESSALRALVEIDSHDAGNPAFTTEAFCGVLACTTLPGDLRTYLRDAVTFANDRLQGTLGANLVVHPSTVREHPALIDEAIAQLRYGCVAVNVWSGVGYFITEAPWGAFPAETPQHMQSGIGVVHNSYFLEKTEKTVVRGPFTPFPRSLRGGEFTLLPRPPWFVTNPMAAAIGQALCDFEMHRDPLHAARVAAIAMRG